MWLQSNTSKSGKWKELLGSVKDSPIPVEHFFQVLEKCSCYFTGIKPLPSKLSPTSQGRAMDRSLIHPSISEVQYLICSLSFSLTPMDQCKFLFISQNKDHAISRNHLLQTAQAFAFPRMVDVFCSSSSKLVINWKLLRFPVPKWVKNTKQDLLNIFFSVIKREKKILIQGSWHNSFLNTFLSLFSSHRWVLFDASNTVHVSPFTGDRECCQRGAAPWAWTRKEVQVRVQVPLPNVKLQRAEQKCHTTTPR